MSHKIIPKPVRLKVCGVTRIEDAHLLLEEGVDAIGLVFYSPSPRSVDINIASQIANAVGPFVTVVGLFVNPQEEFVNEVLSKVPLHVLQFHGDESNEFCSQFGRPFMKAIRMRPELDVETEIKNYPQASAVLLDAYRKGVPGGTGAVFDWSRIPSNSRLPIVLAGGLNPDNIREALDSTSVYALDVSGGLESAPGVKDANLIRSFVSEIKRFNDNHKLPS